jgi:hypothetical protein
VSGKGEVAEDGGEPAEIESPRVTVFVKGDMCGMLSALGCSVPIVVTPVSLALPALDSA